MVYLTLKANITKRKLGTNVNSKKTQNIHHSVPLTLNRPKKAVKTQSTQNCAKMFHLDNLESPQSDW
jgi:hypothetical protein